MQLSFHLVISMHTLAPKVHSSAKDTAGMAESEQLFTIEKLISNTCMGKKKEPGYRLQV